MRRVFAVGQQGAVLRADQLAEGRPQAVAIPLEELIDGGAVLLERLKF